MHVSSLLSLVSALSILGLAFPTEPVSDTANAEAVFQKRDTLPSSNCHYTPCSTDPQCAPNEWASNIARLNLQCPNGLHATYCCPQSNFPTIRNTQSSSGFLHCNTKCNSDEIPIGTNGGECAFSSGPFSICMSQTDSNAPQQLCRWADTCTSFGSNSTCFPATKSSIAYPDAVAWVQNGLGPSVNACPKGQYRPYCCAQPGGPYQNCRLDKTTGNGGCAGVCKVGETMIGSDSDGCSKGQNAWCCSTPMVRDDADYMAIQSSISAISDNKFCPATAAPAPTETSAPNSSKFKRASRPATKEKRDSTILFGNIVPHVVVDAWMDVSLNQTASYNHTIIDEAWDDIMGTTVLPSAELGFRVYEDSLWYDPYDTADFIVCDVDRAQDEEDYLSASDQLCMTVWGNNTKNTYQNKTSTRRVKERSMARNLLDKRVFVDGVNRVANDETITHIGTIMRAVMGGNYNGRNWDPLPLLYTRTFNDPTNAQDTILEVAYDIRSRTDLNGGDPANIFAVFHFHTNRLRMIEINDNLPYPTDYIPEIPRFHVFHGQAVANLRTEANPLWAVRWFPAGTNPANNPSTDRTAVARMQILNCRGRGRNAPNPPGTTPGQWLNWYPGYGMAWRNDPTTGPPGGQAAAAGLINNFGNYLVDQHILGPDTYLNWNDDTQAWNAIDPTTNQNRAPNGTPTNMDPAGPSHWPQ